MAFQMLYNTDIKLAGVFGVSGYMFHNNGFTPDNPTPKRLIFGLQDRVREWPHTKVCFEGKFKPEEIVLVEDMKH
jgi:hypothetical protein